MQRSKPRQVPRASRAPAGPACRAAVCVLVAFLAVACGKAGEKTEPAEWAVDKSYERGPMTLRLRIDRDDITIAETIQLSLEARVEEGYKVEMPKFGEKLEQFGIVDFRESPPKLAGEGHIVVSRTYTLEPFLSGEYTIPPMTVHFWEESAETPSESEGETAEEAEETQRHEIETEEVKISVASLLPEDQAGLQIKEIVPPVEIPRESRRGRIVLVVVLLLAAGGAVGGIWWWRRRRVAEQVVVIPPHERAFQALEAILAQKLLEQGQFKLFYIGVSDVLRHFLEDRFSLHAPERTTEEFLAELAGSNTLGPDRTQVLRDFLEHCDVVKFAEHQPANTEIQYTFDTCKQFILDTGRAPAFAGAAREAA